MSKRFYAALIATFGAQPAAADQALDQFPYPLIAVKGSEAFQEWDKLRSKGGTPIILGAREEVARVFDAFDPSYDDYYDPLEVSLSKADAHRHPASLQKHRMTEFDEFVDSVGDDDAAWASDLDEYDPLAIPGDLWGAWPDLPPMEDRLVSLDSWDTGLPPEIVYITVLPTENSWEAPAYLRFGGWNANPPPDIHVAAFRSWAEEFGAVPVVMQSDLVEMYVTRRPNGPTASRDLAVEHYIYSYDIVDQGVGYLNVLAAILEKSNFWYFWWD